VSDSEFGKTNRLRSEINSDQACCCGHRLKGLNRNFKMPNQISPIEIQKTRRVFIDNFVCVASELTADRGNPHQMMR
jgi:hypothetical protein